MNKIYSRINWENYPSDATPVNEANLNKIDAGLDGVDNRMIEQDAIKASREEISDLVREWKMDEATGIITITKVNGEQVIFDLNIEKIPVSFSLSSDGILTMTTEDGTAFTANIGAMIPVLIFRDSDTVAVNASGSGINKTYSFAIKEGSVTEDKLQPDFLADIKLESAKAESSANVSGTSAAEAGRRAEEAKSYSVGGTGTREGEDTDNARYYMEQAKAIVGGDYVTGIKGEAEMAYRTGNVELSPENLGLGNVENKTSAAIRSEITFQNVVDALGYAPVNKVDLLDLIYPVGSIYQSVNSANPGTLFGGTWEQLQNRFLLAAGSEYVAGSTGGEATHKLSESELPQHRHSIPTLSGKTSDNGDHNHSGSPSGVNFKTNSWVSGNDGNVGTGYNGTTTTNGKHSHAISTNASNTGYTGGANSHNNMPPYLAVYMWKRIS